MINKLSKFLFFYLAYLPLFLILLILNMDFSLKLFYLSGGIILIGFILFLPLLKSIKSIAPIKEEIEIISNNNAEILGFIFTYIIPFLVTFTSINLIVAFSILLILVLFVYIDTPLFSINPTLKVFFGYNIYEIKYKKRRYFLLSKQKYPGGKFSVNIKQLDSEVLIEDD